jgi:HK97 family phage portal protein
MGALTRLADFMLGPKVERDVEPLEGTNISLWDSVIPFWWAENGLVANQNLFIPGDGRLAERVWVANRCIQMNAQQIAAMPLRYEGTSEPAWCSSPDPNWFPNGLSDAIFAVVAQLYGWGFACLYVTDFYATGYPRSWTVLDSSRLEIKVIDGARVYRLGETTLDPAKIVQIDRNPGYQWSYAGGAHGTSALRAYAQQAWGLLAAGNQSMNVSQGGIPTAVLKSQRKLNAEQAQALQTQWMDATQRRNGAPPVLPPELDFTPLSFNPQELGLLEVQDFNAKAIATAFGVPAVLLNMAIRWGMTYQNPAALGEMWWRFELRPTAKRIADALSAQLLPAGQWVWFDAADTFLTLDPTSEEDDPQAAAYAKASPAQTATPPDLTVIGGAK